MKKQQATKTDIYKLLLEKSNNENYSRLLAGASIKNGVNSLDELKTWVDNTHKKIMSFIVSNSYTMKDLVNSNLVRIEKTTWGVNLYVVDESACVINKHADSKFRLAGLLSNRLKAFYKNFMGDSYCSHKQHNKNACGYKHLVFITPLYCEGMHAVTKEGFKSYDYHKINYKTNILNNYKPLK